MLVKFIFRDSKSLIKNLKANKMSITQVFNANRVSINKGQCYFVVQNKDTYYIAKAQDLTTPL